ncbi:hypothetical protein ACLOJK_034887 [Asimina triloba]
MDRSGSPNDDGFVLIVEGAAVARGWRREVSSMPPLATRAWPPIGVCGERDGFGLGRSCRCHHLPMRLAQICHAIDEGDKRGRCPPLAMARDEVPAHLIPLDLVRSLLLAGKTTPSSALVPALAAVRRCTIHHPPLRRCAAAVRCVLGKKVEH